MNVAAIKELLYKVADDQLVIGHRNSEWTGLGPILEEDIAFSSMAQDKLGHAQGCYQILHDLGEAEPDQIAFSRKANQFHNCHFVELPNGEYDFSLMRHFLFDHADQIRFEMFANSSFEPLAKLAKKVKGEIKYHVFHGNTWINKLSTANEVSHIRMQTALNESWNYALGIFEAGSFETELKNEGIFEGENALQNGWLEVVCPLLEKAGLKVPEQHTWEPVLGGRRGYHLTHLEALVTEMSEVFQIDPTATW
jgi:ring-1,2-phenylacetyl-CoA epoxidase subunit PaaC